MGNLTAAERATLKEMAGYLTGYPFRQSTAAKLEARGLCERYCGDTRKRPRRMINAAGRVALKESADDR